MNLKLLWDSETVWEVGIWICWSEAPAWPCGILMLPSGPRGSWYPIETDGCGQPEVTCPVQGRQQAAAQRQYWPPDTRSSHFWRETRNSDFYVRTMEFSLLIFFFNLNLHGAHKTHPGSEFFFSDLCVANSFSWLLVLCGLLLPHLSNMGSCCYFTRPVFWLDLTVLSPDSGDPSLVSGLDPLPGHPHVGTSLVLCLSFETQQRTSMPESVSPSCTLMNSSLWSFMVEDSSYKCLIFTHMLPSFSGQRLNMGSVLKAW